MAPRMTKSKMYSYMRNVGRSFGYAMVDSVKSMNPTVTALFKTTAEQSRDLYQSVKNFDAKSLGFEDSDLKGTLGQAVKDLKNNALEDIRTGKWYNKDRMNRYETEMAQDMFGINFDDFGDFDDFNFEDTDLDEEASITEDATKATVKAMDEVGGKVSTAVSTAAIKSADYIVESNRINTKAIYGLTQAGFSQVNKGVATMNGNLQLLVSLAEPITTHIQNSALFYTKSQEYQNKSLEYLKQIAANTSPKSSNNYKSSSRGKSYTDFITSEGVIDIAALFENGAKRMKENTEMITSMLSFVPGGEKALLKMATASPLQFALTSAISAMFGMEDKQGNSIKKSFENFNKVLADFSLGLLGRAKKATFGDNIFSPFLRGIRDFLLPSDGNIQKKVNSGAYEKGKVDWDGISRRAITEVIPKQLGQILSILERNFGPAGNYRVYDYDKGQFKDTRRVSAESRLAQRQITRSAGGDLFNDIRSSLKYSGMDTKTRRGYEKQIDSLLEYMMLSGNYDLLSSNFDFKKAGMSSSVAADLQKRIRAIQQTRGGQVKLSGLGGSVYSARNKFDARNRNASSVENSLVDNSIAGRQILNGSDQYGMTQSDYLVKILYHVSYISKNLKNLVATPGVGGFSNDGSQIHWEDGDKITQSNNRTSDLNTRSDRIAPMELGRNYNVNDAINRATGTKSSPYTDAEEKILAKYGGDPEKIPDDEPLKDAILRKYNFEQMKGAASSFASGAYGRLKGGKLGGAIGKVENYLGTSTEEVTAALDKVSGALNDFVYDNKTGIYALMNTMTAGVLDMIKGLIPKEVRDLISAGWKKLKESKFGKATGETLRNIAFSFFGKKKEEKVYDAPDAGLDFVPVDDEDYFEVPGAHGSGLIRRINSATSRIYSNQRSGGNFWGNYSRSVSPSPRTGYAGGRSRSRRRSYKTRKFSGGATGTTDEAAAEPPEEEVSDEAVESLFHRISSKVSSSIINKISDVIGKNDPEKEKKDVKGTIEKLMKEAGLAKGAIGAGAVIGGGASLLTGAFLGPIAGAAIGAAAGFVAKSETAQKFLFGEWDEEKGEYTGNSLLPKEVGKFFKQNGAATGKGAGAGMLIGTFMGSPIMGAILGATAGYIGSSDKAKKFIFGDMEKDEEGLIPLSLQKTLKEKFPFFAGGIGAALLFAPGPLIPKIAIGATLGAIIGEDKGEGLKTWFFGEKGQDGKRKGGFLGHINDNLFKPIIGTVDKAFNMLTKGLKDTLTQATRKLFSVIGGLMEKSFLGRGVKRVGKGITSLGGNLAKGVVSIAGSPFKAANKALEMKALKSGYAFRGEDNQYLSSSERLKLAAEKGYKYRETGSTLIDQYLKNLSPEEYDQFLADMEAAEKGDDAGNARIAQILAGSHTTKLKYKDITHAIQQVKIDKDKYNKNKEAQEKLKEDPTYNITNRIPTLIESVVSAIYGIDNTLRKRFHMEPITVPATEGGNSTGNEVDNTEDIVNENGEYSNASNIGRRKFNEKKGFLESVGSLPVIGVGVTKIIDIMTSIKKSIIGDGDKKPGLFDRIKEALIGENGLLGGILGFFTGSTAIGGTVGKLLGKFNLANLGSFAMKGLGLFALYKALHGDFDEIGKKIPTGSNDPNGDNGLSDTWDEDAQKPEDATQEKNSEEETEATKGRDYYTDANGNRVRVGSDNKISTRLKKNLASGLIMGKSSVVTAGIKKITGIDISTKGVGAALGKIASGNADDLVMSVCTPLLGIFKKICGCLKKLPIIGKAIENSDELAQGIVQKIGQNLSKAGNSAMLKKAAGLLQNALVVLKVAYIAGRVIDGWGNAETILGIVDDATIGQRFIAALIAGANAAIPFIGDLIPDKVLVDIFMWVAEQLGLEGVEGLQKQREEATSEVQAYIDATGDTSMTIEKYNQLGYTMNEDGTFTQGKARAGLITKAKMRVTGFIDDVKEKGFGNVAGEALGKAGTAISNAASKVVDTSKKLFAFLKEQIFDVPKDAITKGDFKGIFDVTLPEDTPMAGLVKGIVIGARLINMPKILVYTAGTAIVNGVKKMIEKVKTNINAAKEGFKYGWETVHTKGSSLSDFFRVEEPDPENPIGGFTKGITIASRLAAIPMALLKRCGEIISDKIKAVIDRVKSEAEQYMQISTSLHDTAVSGDIAGLWSTDVSALGSDENPVGGLQQALAFGNKLTYTPIALVHAAGNKIKEFFTPIIDKVKSEASQYVDVTAKIMEASQTGDIKALWEVDIDSVGTEDNPVGGIQKGLAFGNKLMLSLPTITKGIGIKVGEFFDKIKDSIATDHKNMDDKNKTIKGYAEKGEIGKIWSENFNTEKLDPIGGIWKAGYNITRVFQSIVALFNKLSGPIEEVIGKVTETYEKVTGAVDNAKENVKNAATTAGNWVANQANNAYNNVVNFVTGGSGSGVVSQLDPRYSRYSVGGKSFAANGCGPASAVMATGGDMRSAVNIAQRYQTAGGTDAAYFGEMFNRRGMKAHYYLAGGSSLIGDIASGKPTVLMGQDVYNTSKANSPFGPNNHYVVANGFDGSGNLLISDPEQRGIRRYNPGILRNVKVGVSGGSTGTQYGTGYYAGGIDYKTDSRFTNTNTTQSGMTNDPRYSAPKTDTSSTNQYANQQYIPGVGVIDTKTGAVMTPKATNDTPVSELPVNGGENGSVDTSNMSPSDQRAAYIYALFKKNGSYAPGAICGILANLQAESGMDPTALQKTKSGIHHAAGIAQWENYAQQSGRWLNLKKFAESKGVMWTDLDTQIEFIMDEVEGLGSYFRANCGGISVADFKKQTDPKKATLQFQQAFERGNPEKAHMNTRYQYAEDFFRKFSGLSQSEIDEILANGAFGGGDIGNATDEKAATDKKNGKDKVTIGGIFSTITSAFANAFSKLFNGSSEEEEGEGTEGITSSDGSYGTSSISGTDPVSYMESVKNKITYTFGAKDPEGGKADCSGTVNWAVKKASGIDLGGSTLSMYNSKNLKPVWYNNGATTASMPASAKRNDILLFSRPKSDYTKGRPDRVGHVGIYTGEGNKFIEIGKGTGTYESNLTSGSNLIKVGRLIDDNGNEIEFLNDPGTTVTDPIEGNAEERKNYGNAKAQAKAEKAAVKGKTDATVRGEAAMGSGLLHYGPSKAGNYILRDNTRNYYRQGAGSSGTVNPVSGGSLLDIARGAVNKTASSAKQSAKDLGAIPANVSAIRQDTNDMNATLKTIAEDLSKLLEARNEVSASGSGLPTKKSNSRANNMTSADYAANKELQSIMESIITSAV